MTEHIQAAIKEADRVAKKQRVCATKTSDSLNNLIDELTAAKHRIATEGTSEGVIKELNQRLGQLNTVHTISEQTKDLHSTVNKLSKAIDKAFVPDICKASKGKQFDDTILNQVIAEHFFHTGQFEVGQSFVEEAKVQDGSSLQEPYREMHQVLKEMAARNLQPALEWCEYHQPELNIHGFGDELSFRLRELEFLNILSCQGLHVTLIEAARPILRMMQLSKSCPRALLAEQFPLTNEDGSAVVCNPIKNSHGRASCYLASLPCQYYQTNGSQLQGHQAALGYARQQFEAFQGSQMPAIQRLMGCLCYIKRPDSSPYADLMAPSRWDAVSRDFARQCCGILGRATQSPLLVTVAAGAMALPTLLKLASVLAAQGKDLHSMENAVELDLGREFVFRSVFACPVSREQSHKGNPPMMLPCGHMLCKQSVYKICKSSSRSFKCPYCPIEASLALCQEVHFLDLV